MTQTSGLKAKPRANRWLDSLQGYVPGKHGGPGAQNVIRLSSNECPQGPSPKAVEAAQSVMGGMHRYADASATFLREAIAQKHGLDPDRIICGTGSDEILQVCPLAYCAPGDEVIHTDYGFMMYPISARRAGAVPVSVPETQYTADVDAILSAVTGKTRIVYLANPNNPTGTLLPPDEIERLHAGLPGTVLLVLDGAYAEYVDAPDYDAGLALAKSAPNVLMTRTFSKLYGLAGERIGWATGPADVLKDLNKIRAPFNVTAAGQAAALAALADEEWQAAVVAENRAVRAALHAALERLGLSPIPSHANFILCLFDEADLAGRTVAALADRGIYVRHLPKMGLGHAIRMGVGTAAENDALIAALEAIVPTL